MASLFLSGGCDAESEEDWMPPTPRDAATRKSTPPVFPSPEFTDQSGATCKPTSPAQSPGSRGQRAATSRPTSPSWMQPLVGDSQQSLAPGRRSGRGSARDTRAARAVQAQVTAALRAAHAATNATEAAARLAHLAMQQGAQTKASAIRGSLQCTPVKKKGKEAVDTQTPSPKPVGHASCAGSGAAMFQDDDEGVDPTPPVKKRGRPPKTTPGDAGAKFFAGRQPTETNVDEFALKRKLYQDVQGEMKENHQGRKSHSKGTTLQQRYWAHTRDFLANKKKVLKVDKFSPDQSTAAIKEAAAEWRAILLKEAEAPAPVP